MTATLRLFCLPPAGGASAMFASWFRALPAAIDVRPLELPGRGARLRETPATGLGSLVERLSTEVADELDLPFAVFGHSMGALVAYELVHELRERYGRSPELLLVSAHRAPHLPMRMNGMMTASLDDAQLMRELKRLGGIPEPLLRDPELMDLMLPALRADLTACEAYQYVAWPPLTCPIQAFCGIRDPVVSRGEVDAWQAHTSAGFAVDELDAGHGYLRDPQLVLAVSRALR